VHVRARCCMQPRRRRPPWLTGEPIDWLCCAHVAAACLSWRQRWQVHATSCLSVILAAEHAFYSITSKVFFFPLAKRSVAHVVHLLSLDLWILTKGGSLTSLPRSTELTCLAAPVANVCISLSTPTCRTTNRCCHALTSAVRI
jgi:hypothetical protein